MIRYVLFRRIMFFVVRSVIEVSIFIAMCLKEVLSLYQSVHVNHNVVWRAFCIGPGEILLYGHDEMSCGYFSVNT